MISEAQKVNLNKLLEKYSFEHLRPPPQVFQISIPEEEYFIDINGHEKRRKIYYKVNYDPKELQAIEEVRRILNQRAITQQIGDELILKHVYGSKWDIEKTVQRIQQVIEFHKNETITKFNGDTIRQLQKGSVYCYGHDKKMQPIIIMRVDKIDLTLSIEQNLNIIYYLFLVVLGFKMVPYHAEKYTLIMDFNDINLSDIPYGYLYDALQKLGLYYCGNTERTLIYNSTGFGNVWRFVSMFLPEYQKRKIIFIPKGEEKKVQQCIDLYELQNRYGGKLPNLNVFWPPQITNDQFQIRVNNSDSDFYSVQNDDEFFRPQKECLCSCNIY